MSFFLDCEDNSRIHQSFEVKCQMMNVKCEMMNAKCEKLNVKSRKANVKQLILGGNCQKANVKCQKSKFQISNSTLKVIVYAKTDPKSKPAHGITAFIVEESFPGFHKGINHHLD